MYYCIIALLYHCITVHVLLYYCITVSLNNYNKNYDIIIIIMMIVIIIIIIIVIIIIIIFIIVINFSHFSDSKSEQYNTDSEEGGG